MVAMARPILITLTFVFWAVAGFAQNVPGCGPGNAAACEEIRARKVLDSTQFPWRAMGRVNFANTRERSHCAGTLIYESIVLSAAHCVYDANRGKWVAANDLVFVAGYHRGEFAATSKVAFFVTEPSYTPQASHKLSELHKDWVLMVLEDPIGREIGFIPVAEPRDLQEIAVLAGYPAIRAHVLSQASDCGVLSPVHDGDLLMSDCSAMSGDSGGAFLVEIDGIYKLAAVVAAVVISGDKPNAIGLSQSTWGDAFQALLLGD